MDSDLNIDIVTMNTCLTCCIKAYSGQIEILSTHKYDACIFFMHIYMRLTSVYPIRVKF